MKNRLKIFAAGLMLGTTTQVFAQDIHFSQFYENSILRNPALTGIFSGDYKVGIDYRDQWGSIANPYRTVSATGETRILVNREVADYVSIGLGAYYDKAGAIEFTSQEIYPSVAFNKAINDEHKSYLSVGFAGGYMARFVDMSKMTLSSQVINGVYSSSNPSGETAPFKSLHNFDLGAGISLNSSIDRDNRANYYLGISLYHINHPTQIFNGGYSEIKLPMKWQFAAGVSLAFSEKFSLSLHGNYSRQQPYNETVYGGLLTYHAVTPGLPSIFAFSFGGFYRYQDAFIPTVKIDYANMSFGVSYDVNNSSLSTATAGTGTAATEISLYVRGRYNHKNNPRDGIMCPRFESEILYPFNN